jgi:hypothetical protein
MAKEGDNKLKPRRTKITGRFHTQFSNTERMYYNQAERFIDGAAEPRYIYTINGQDLADYGIVIVDR